MWENVYEKGGGIPETLILEPGRPTVIDDRRMGIPERSVSSRGRIQPGFVKLFKNSGCFLFVRFKPLFLKFRFR
jgi:hypothetical protein